MPHQPNIYQGCKAQYAMRKASIAVGMASHGIGAQTVSRYAHTLGAK